MPLFMLSKKLVFPPVHLAEPEGVLAIGGDLSVERLLLAYRNGIFPWYSDGEPILWWTPDPRFVLFPERLHVSKSMHRLLKTGRFQVTLDRAFPKVIRECQKTPRRNQPGTWLTGAMLNAYCRLHEAGYAHSVEVWEDDVLAGGLYGVSLGRCFFGESMFTKVSNASKVGLIGLVDRLREWEFPLIDCQVETAHLASLGAEPIPRVEFMRRLHAALRHPDRRGSWDAA